MRVFLGDGEGLWWLVLRKVVFSGDWFWIAGVIAFTFIIILSVIVVSLLVRIIFRFYCLLKRIELPNLFGFELLFAIVNFCYIKDSFQ